MNYSTKIDYLGSMNSVYPTAGGQVFIRYPRWTNSLGLLIDAGISGVRGSFKDSILWVLPRYEEFNFSAFVLTGKLNLKYIYPKGKIRPAAEAGLSYFGLFNESNRLYYEERYMGENRVYEMKDGIRFSESALFGFNCGIGIDYPVKNNKSVFCRFYYDNASNALREKDMVPTDRIKVGQFKIGYTF